MSQKRNMGLFLAIVAVSEITMFLPVPGLSPAGRRTLGVFVFAALCWITEVIPLAATGGITVGLLALLLPPVLNGVNVRTFYAAFSAPVIVLFAGGYFLAAAMQKYCMDEIFTAWILRRTGTKPKMVLGGMMIATAFLSMWMSNTATTALMIAVALPVVRKIKDDPFSVALLLGIPFAANVGGIATPIGTPPNAIAIEFLADAGKKISFRIVDPDRNPKLAKQHDITAYGQVAVVCGEKSHTLADPDEEKITNTIKRLAFGGGKKLYFLVGHGEPSPYSDKPYGTVLFAQQVRYEGLDFDTLNLVFAGGIPEDAAVVCVISPKSNPTPAELGTLLTYFVRGGKLLVAVEPGEADSVRGWLKNFGVRAENAMIFDNSPQSTSFGLGIEMPLITAYSGDHPITADFNQFMLNFFRGIKVRGKNNIMNFAYFIFFFINRTHFSG